MKSNRVATGKDASAPSPLVIDPGENPSGYMRGIPVPVDKRVTRHLSWITDRDKALWAVQNVNQIVPVDIIGRGPGPVWDLPYGPSVLDSVTTAADGRKRSLGAAVAEMDANGFVAIKGGRIVAEVYRNGLRPDTRHAMFSMTKSFVGMTCGILIGEGLLDPNRPVRDYLPELASCGFRDASLQHVMDMTASVDWNQDREDPRASVNLNTIAGGFTSLPIDVPFTDTLEFIQSLGPKDAHGSVFTYNAANTEILGWIISRVTGRPWQRAFADLVWSRLGAEQDALITVDGGGHGFATGGMTASLRDLGRLGLVVLRGGLANSVRIAPEAFFDDLTCNDPALQTAMQRSDRNMGGNDHAYYRSHFWVLDAARGELKALGFLGQLLYVDRASETVVVFLSAVVGLETWMRQLVLAREIAASAIQTNS